MCLLFSPYFNFRIDALKHVLLQVPSFLSSPHCHDSLFSLLLFFLKIANFFVVLNYRTIQITFPKFHLTSGYTSLTAHYFILSSHLTRSLFNYYESCFTDNFLLSAFPIIHKTIIFSSEVEKQLRKLKAI